MKLSKDTWHYRNFDAWCRRSRTRMHRPLRKGLVQPNLCLYTRIALIYGPLHRYGALMERNEKVMGATVLTGMYSIVLFVTYVIVSGTEDLGWYWWHFLMPIGVGLSVAAFIAIIIGLDKLTELIKAKRQRKQAPVREPNIILEYAKAKKRKICPFIEFKD